MTIEGQKHYARLYKASNGQRCKKFQQKRWHFGVEPDTALSNWRYMWPIIVCGGAPTAVKKSAMPGAESITVLTLCNCFAISRKQMHEAGQISYHTYHKYRDQVQAICRMIGPHRVVATLTQADFRDLKVKIASKYALSSQSDYMVTTRRIFTWAHAEELISKVPRFGYDFAQ